jgi:O-antigen ligase
VRLERAQLGFLGALAATIPVSIFAAEVALACGVMVLAVRLARAQARLVATALDAPLLAFAVWTLLSASFADDPSAANGEAKELLLFALFYVAVSALARGEDRERVLSALLLGGIGLGGLVVLQYHVLGYDSLDRRPSGFLGHWMSSSGILMGVLVTAASRLAFGARETVRPRDGWLAGLVLVGVGGVAALGTAAGALPTRLFVAGLAAGGAAVVTSRRDSLRAALPVLPWVAFPLTGWALVVSQTRNAWLGALLGLTVIAVMRAPRLLWGLAAVVAVLLLVRPEAVTNRLTVTDRSSIDRYYQWQAGVDMVLDRPIFGQGPGMILATYPRYRWPEAPNPTTPHLHNNALQIAATRGLPCLVFFAWWVLVALATALAEARRAWERSPVDWPAVAALAGWTAILLSGVFEYNLGDSEVLMLALLLTSMPFARRRERAEDGPRET